VKRSILIATILGAALVHERRRHAETARLAAATLETLLNAIDANDEETGAHVRRVAKFALILAGAAGLDERECRSVERVALFHDIGKIDEALFDIIHDESALDDREREKIATHPAGGAEVLEPLDAFYPDLAAGVLSHHERWDGGGYPRKLKGEQIPLSARVVAIADTFDAITHSRRYRAGKSIDEAMNVLIHGRGTEFDPQLVDLFVAPAIHDRLEAVVREGIMPKRKGTERRRLGAAESNVPDVTFRWRSGGTASHAAGPSNRRSR
jgi:HD-GYP domain-containing protein (c-di-GMP phosphodiesterase class II)